MTEPQHHFCSYQPASYDDEEEEAQRMQEFRHMCQRLAVNDPNIHKVETSDGGFVELRSDNEAAHLAKALQGNTYVEILSLGLLGVSVRGAAYLQGFVSNSDSLYCVCLEGSFLEGDTEIFPQDVSAVHLLVQAAKQNTNEINLFLSNCPVARSSLMAAVSRSSHIGQFGATNCILVEDQQQQQVASLKDFAFSDTLYGITYGQDITPSQPAEAKGMMAMGHFLSQICGHLPNPLELRVDLGNAVCNGFDWRCALPNADNFSTIQYRMLQDERHDELFFHVLTKGEILEDLILEMPSRLESSKHKIQALTGAILKNPNVTSVELSIRRTAGQNTTPMPCHIPQLEAHCANNRRLLQDWTEQSEAENNPGHSFPVEVLTAF